MTYRPSASLLVLFLACISLLACQIRGSSAATSPLGSTASHPGETTAADSKVTDDEDPHEFSRRLNRRHHPENNLGVTLDTDKEFDTTLWHGRPSTDLIPVVVALHRPLTQEEREDLEHVAGVPISGYIPRNAYLFIFNQRAAKRVEVLPLVRSLSVPNSRAKLSAGFAHKLQLQSQNTHQHHVLSFAPGSSSQYYNKQDLSVRLPHGVHHAYRKLALLDADASTTNTAPAPDGTLTQALMKEWTTGLANKLGIAPDHVQIRPAKESHDKLIISVPQQFGHEAAEWLAGQPLSNWIEAPGKFRILNEESQWIIQSYKPDYRPLWKNGMDGNGEVVTVADTGVSTGTCMWFDKNHKAPLDTVTNNHRKIVAYRCDNENHGHDCDDSHGHGTHVATTICGSVTDEDRLKYTRTAKHEGMAPGAKIAVFDMSQYPDGGLDSPEDLNQGLFPWSYKETTSRIFSASWGEDSHNYTMASLEADIFSHEHRDWLVVLACGNDGQIQDDGGFFQVVPPGNAKNSLAVASSAAVPMSSIDDVSSFSSSGPTPDGRIKPDVVVPGENILSGAMHRLGYCSTETKSGTSMAAPCAAGAAAIVRQYYRQGFHPTGEKTVENQFTPSAALVKATIIASAQPLLGVAHTVTRTRGYTSVPLHGVPDVYQGFGIVRLDHILHTHESGGGSPSLQMWAFNSTDKGMVTGGEDTYCFEVLGDDWMPFSATLVWTDPPPPMQYEVSLVNNLNLIVHSKDGIWTGNHELYGDLPDNLNTVERVRLPNATSGEYIVTVKGADIPHGPQAYSLVVAAAGLVKLGECRRLVCPYMCSGHGSCVEGVCICDTGYSGASCSTTSDPVVPGAEALVSKVQAFHWQFWHVDVAEGDSTALTVMLHTPQFTDPDLYVAKGRLPTLTDFDYKDDLQHQDSIIEAAANTPGRYYIGVYGYCCTHEYEIRIQVVSTTSCQLVCHNGDCIAGKCQCVEGWKGDGCVERIPQADDELTMTVTSSATTVRVGMGIVGTVLLLVTTTMLIA